MKIHQPVEPPDPFDINQISHASQMLSHPGNPVEGLVKVLLIDDPHQIKVERVFRTGLII